MPHSHHHWPHLLPAARPAAGYLSRVDPRLRVLAAVGLALVVAAAQQFATLGIALAAAVTAVGLSGLPWKDVLRRLLPLEALVLLLVVLLPFTTPGTAQWRSGPLVSSQEGLVLGAKIALKGNAMVLGLVALVGSMDATMLGHALAHLRVPRKLTHLLLLTVRYLDVLHREYRRMRAAMKVRSFRPRLDLHTYRAFGYLIGMLLVRSFDRSERIMAAMKCRGFQGRFYLLDHFAFSGRRDAPFCLVSVALLGLLVFMEWK
jgi:cobalt/nickel transport system permease protein